MVCDITIRRNVTLFPAVGHPVRHGYENTTVTRLGHMHMLPVNRCKYMYLLLL